MLSCNEDDLEASAPLPKESSSVTVRDLTGLDGCGLVLELPNGDYLEPYFPSASERDSQYYSTTQWDDIEPRDGLKLRMAYDTLSDRVSTCMVGSIVGITSLEVVDRSSE